MHRLTRTWFSTALALPLVIAWLGCQASVQNPAVDTTPETVPAGPAWFADVTADVGLNFTHDAGPLPNTQGRRYFMPQAVGSGGALFDFDNDGRLDVLLLHNAGPDSSSTNRLFRQGSDGRFTDVSKGSGLDVAGYGMGAAAGDVNNDGWVDLCITEYDRTRLFLNQGNGRFAEITQTAGIDNPLWGTSLAFVDYNRDGWLDLVVVNYLQYDPSRPCTERDGSEEFCGPSNFPGTVTKLFRTRGRKPDEPASTVGFDDVTLTVGLGRLPGPGLGVVCADFNGDRWPDILVANDGKANALWINQRGETFTEEAVLRGVAYNGLGLALANMGIAHGDVDGDGLFDLFVTHLTEENHVFWRQGPVGQFVDRTSAAGLATPCWRGTGFGTLFADFDHDGAADLAVVNGRVRRGVGSGKGGAAFWDRYAERHQVFANLGDGRFRDVSPNNPALCDVPSVGRGLACGDIDNDGALDLLVTSIAGPARLYRNVAPNRGHWLVVRAVDPALRRDAYGAEVIVRVGERRWVRWLNPAYSYVCSNDPRGHFGLGKADHVDAIDVVWTDGTEETFPGRAVDQAVVLTKGEGVKRPPSAAPASGTGEASR